MDICKDYNLKKYSSASSIVENVKKKLLKDRKFRKTLFLAARRPASGTNSPTLICITPSANISMETNLPANSFGNVNWDFDDTFLTSTIILFQRFLKIRNTIIFYSFQFQNDAS